MSFKEKIDEELNSGEKDASAEVGDKLDEMHHRLSDKDYYLIGVNIDEISDGNGLMSEGQQAAARWVSYKTEEFLEEVGVSYSKDGWQYWLKGPEGKEIAQRLTEGDPLRTYEEF